MPNLNFINRQPPRGISAPVPAPAISAVVPEMGRIPAAVAAFGISRSALYRLAAANPGLFKKLNRSTMVDFAILRQITSGLPNARIGAGEG